MGIHPTIRVKVDMGAISVSSKNTFFLKIYLCTYIFLHHSWLNLYIPLTIYLATVAY